MFQFSGHLLQLFFNSYIFVWKQQGNYYQSWFEAPVEYEELKLYNYDHKEFVPHGLGQIWKFHFFCTVMKRSKRKVVLLMKNEALDLIHETVHGHLVRGSGH